MVGTILCFARLWRLVACGTGNDFDLVASRVLASTTREDGCDFAFDTHD